MQHPREEDSLHASTAKKSAIIILIPSFPIGNGTGETQSKEMLHPIITSDSSTSYCSCDKDVMSSNKTQQKRTGFLVYQKKNSVSPDE
jgi:hypothetical protein